MIRVPAAIVAAALAGTALGACGQAASTLTIPHAKSGADSSPGAGENIPAHGLARKAQAIAFANAVNLKLKDLPGFKIAPSEQGSNPFSEHGTTVQPRLERAMLECTGIFNGESELAQIASKEYERVEGSEELGASSSISIARTPTAAARGLVVKHEPGARSCLARYLSRQVEHNPKGGSNVLSITPSPEQALAPGTSGGVVLRVLADIVIGGKPVPLTLNFYGFVCGQAQIGLFTTSLPRPFPPGTRRQLLTLLLNRARAHGQCAKAPAGAPGALAQ